MKTKLQRGEKFEKMWEELSKRYGNYWSAFDVRKGNDVEYKYIDELMDDIKQKYFPVEETYNGVPISKIKVGLTD